MKTGWEKRPQDDLFCVEWHVKPLSQSISSCLRYDNSISACQTTMKLADGGCERCKEEEKDNQSISGTIHRIQRAENDRLENDRFSVDKRTGYLF